MDHGDRRFCLGLAAALTLLFGCSSSGETTGGGSTGGSAGASSGGASSGGASSGGTSSGGTGSGGGSMGGKGGASGSGTAGDSAGGAAASGTPCPDGTTVGDSCEAVDATCTGAQHCCRCASFPNAPSCGLQWDCATPSNSAADCPEEAPNDGDPCDTLNLSCQYCPSTGPRFLSCGRETAGSDVGIWSESVGLSCNE
jgi:hypothetical protein